MLANNVVLGLRRKSGAVPNLEALACGASCWRQALPDRAGAVECPGPTTKERAVPVHGGFYIASIEARVVRRSFLFPSLDICKKASTP